MVERNRVQENVASNGLEGRGISERKLVISEEHIKF